MKNFKFSLHTVAAFAIASIVVACSSDDEMTGKQSGVKQTVTLTAFQPTDGTDDESGTRMGFDKTGAAYWQTGDQIGVSAGTSFTKFSLKTGAGEATATFEGQLDATASTTHYAVYPYHDNSRINDAELTYYLPASYTYTKVAQTVLTDKDGHSFCAPMWGKVDDNNNVKFSHLGGVICIKIDKMPAESGTVKVTEASNTLCGEFTATLTDETPEIKTQREDDGENFAVTFTYSGATQDQPGVFYLPVATGTYNLTIAVNGGNKTSVAKATALTMTRTKLKVVNVTTNYTEYTKESDGSITIGGHKFIDLGLPSGTLWAETNVGAESATDNGDYFQWGDTSPKTTATCTQSTYKYYQNSDYTKYTYSGKTELETDDDAAYTVWGSFCHMPTKNQMYELIKKHNGISWGNNGWTVSGNSNSIFLKAAGNRQNKSTNGSGSTGYYWSSTLYSTSSTSAYSLYFLYNEFEDDIFSRWRGCSVRAVAEPQ